MSGRFSEAAMTAAMRDIADALGVSSPRTPSCCG